MPNFRTVSPGMAEFGAVPWNGYKVVSAFSSCGDSCLGYRIAR
jgi:hypothetical protein